MLKAAFDMHCCICQFVGFFNVVNILSFLMTQNVDIYVGMTLQNKLKIFKSKENDKFLFLNYRFKTKIFNTKYS